MKFFKNLFKKKLTAEELEIKCHEAQKKVDDLNIEIRERDEIIVFLEEWQKQNPYNPSKLDELNARFIKDICNFLLSKKFSEKIMKEHAHFFDKK